MLLGSLPSPDSRQPGGFRHAPRLVIVIDDLGAASEPVQRLLALSYPVTLAFWPHGGHTAEGARAAWRAGREILVHHPMQPLGYPGVKAGPRVLTVGMDPAEIARLVNEGIDRVPHAVGLNNHMGSRFTQDVAGTHAVLEALERRGLFVLDSVTHPRSVFAAEAARMGLQRYSRNVFLDVTATRGAVLAELRKAERIALMTGQAIAIGHPLPATLEALREWQKLRNPAVRLVRLQDLPGR